MLGFKNGGGMRNKNASEEKQVCPKVKLVVRQRKGQSMNLKKESRRRFVQKELLERNLMHGQAKPEMNLLKNKF